MFDKIKKIAVSALVSFGVLATIPATAQAHGNHHGGGAGFGIWFGESGHSHWRRPGARRGGGDWHNGRRYNPIGRAHRCSPRRALNKARRMGVRNAHIRRVDHRVIKVRGRSHGYRVRIVFARAPGCPVIRY